MKRIAIIVPSRGRPDAIAELIATLQWSIDDPSVVDLHIGLDDDDAYRYDPWDPSHNVYYYSMPRMNAAGWTNLLAASLWDDYEILGFMGDDHRPRTAGWDNDVRTAFDEMGSGLVYTDDGYQGERLPTAPFWSSDVIKELGWYFQPALAHMYADNVWLALGKAIGRCTYLPDVVIEHMHPAAGKGVDDETYRGSNAMYGLDETAFRVYMATQFDSDVAMLKETLSAIPSNR